MVIYEDKPSFSPFVSRATLPRVLLRTFCFFVLSMFAAFFLVQLGISLGDLDSLLPYQRQVSLLLVALAIAEYFSAVLKHPRAIAPGGLYAFFLFFAVLMVASLFDRAYELALVPAVLMMAFGVALYRTDPFFRSMVTDTIGNEELPYEDSAPRSKLSERRSARRKQRKNRTRR